MSRPIVTVIVDLEGNVQVEVSKVQGPGCKSLTKELEVALGTIEHTAKKPEYNVLTEETRAQQTLGGGTCL